MQVVMGGARLAYVVRKLEGTVMRPVTKWDRKTGLTTKMEKQDAGYIVYFPRGHVLRLNADQLKQYQLDGTPQIINMQGLHHPKSPMGKLMSAQDDATRKGAMNDLEEAVVQLATRKTGNLIMPEQVQNEPTAA